MGTTSPKNLRYPEPTAEGRTMPARIQDLATDVNTVLTAHDARFDGLDSKTNTTNSSLALRGMPDWRYGNAAGVYTHSPNDGINRVISQHTDQFYVHPSANYIQISMSQASYCGNGGGAAGVWYPQVLFGSTGSWQLIVNAHSVHNQQQPALDLGFHLVGIINAQPYRGMNGSIGTSFTNDATSAGWILHGNLFWSVVSLK